MKKGKGGSGAGSVTGKAKMPAGGSKAAKSIKGGAKGAKRSSGKAAPGKIAKSSGAGSTTNTKGY